MKIAFLSGSLLAEIFFIAFFINLLYELLHSPLYKTCLDMPLQKYVPLILRASFFDGIWIVAIYLITGGQIILFSVISILFAYFWELYSVGNKRWEYSAQMPLIFAAGLTPTFQLFLTGIMTLYIVFVL